MSLRMSAGKTVSCCPPWPFLSGATDINAAQEFSFNSSVFQPMFALVTTIM